VLEMVRAGQGVSILPTAGLPDLSAGSDTLNDQPTSEHIGAGVSVRHKDLLRVNARHIHSVRRSAHFQAGTPSTTSQVTTPRPRFTPADSRRPTAR
jgi:hypothetical protein